MATKKAEDKKTENQPTENLSDEATSLASSLTEEERAAINELSYEQARDQLAQAVQDLEAGGLDLDASMRQWELGEALAQRAQTLLDEVRNKLDAAQAQQASAGANAGTQGNLE